MKITKPWITIIVAALFPFYTFAQMNILNEAGLYLLDNTKISAQELGILSASYLYANALFLLPAGILLDRFSTRFILTSCLGINVIGVILFTIANDFPLMALGRFLSGLGHAFSLLGCFRLAIYLFPPSRQAFVIGLILTLASLGGLIVQTPLALLIQTVGWHLTSWINIGVGILIIMLIFWIAPDTKVTKSSSFSLQLLLSDLTTAWRNSQNWLSGLYTSLMGLPGMILGALWGASYLIAYKFISSLQASWVISAIFLGTIIGSPLIGWISDRYATRKIPMLMGATLAFFTMLALLFIPGLSTSSLIILFFTLGFFSSSQIIGYAVVTESNAKQIASTAMGFVNVIIMSGIASFQLLFSWLWANSVLQPYATWIILLALATSAVLAAFLRKRIT